MLDIDTSNNDRTGKNYLLRTQDKTTMTQVTF